MTKKSLRQTICIILLGLAALGIGVLLFLQNDKIAVPEIKLDDERYMIQSGKVLIPAGRPRIPQIVCDEADEIYQAYFPDGVEKAAAQVVCGEDVYEIDFIKDKTLGFELQFGDYYQFVPAFSAQKEITYWSSDDAIATVDKNGEILIRNVSESGVVITADDGYNKEELVITRTIRTPISIYMLAGQSNAEYYYADPQTATQAKKGTAYLYNSRLAEFVIESITNDDGTMKFGNIEASLVNRLYRELGEKVIIMNTGISGMKIEEFLPEQKGFETIKDSWRNFNTTMQTEWFQERFEPRIKSYIWVQGESDDWLAPELYMERFLIMHSMLRSPDFGFDYAFICNVAPRFFRPNDAQERLAQAYDDIFMGSRGAFGFTPESGELREDNLHYTQQGDNVLGDEIGKTIALVYQGKSDTLPEGEKD